MSLTEQTSKARRSCLCGQMSQVQTQCNCNLMMSRGTSRARCFVRMLESATYIRRTTLQCQTWTQQMGGGQRICQRSRGTRLRSILEKMVVVEILLLVVAENNLNKTPLQSPSNPNKRECRPTKLNKTKCKRAVTKCETHDEGARATYTCFMLQSKNGSNIIC